MHPLSCGLNKSIRPFCEAVNDDGYEWYSKKAVNILFYSPMKPIDHPNPSGDQTTAIGLVSFLKSAGHSVETASRVRARYGYWKPWLIPKLLADLRHIERLASFRKPDLFLTHHTYYKAPDILGPVVSKRLRIPYVVFQGIYSTKHRRNPKTWPGYVLNRKALVAAAHVFTNRRVDHENLKRLISEERLSYIRPGIDPRGFGFSQAHRYEWRHRLKIPVDMPVLVSAAMFRPGVKADGISWMIEVSGRLSAKGFRHVLLIAGDGPENDRLKSLASANPSIVFLGKIPRNRMCCIYSAGDVFAFPGIRESLGMVYLEAQSCGLPVVAFDNGGIAEVVRRNETGFLTPPFDSEAFDRAIIRLLTDLDLRRRMGEAGARSVRMDHDASRNFGEVECVLQSLQTKCRC